MKKLPYIWILALLLIGLQACKAANSKTQEPDQPSFRQDGYLQIRSAEGELKASFDIEIVSKEYELARGLKYRDSMAENQGMLFIFAFADYHGFWMQDTYISLDMLFIDLDNNIVTIAEHTSPFSEEQINPEKPIKYVLEVIAGTANKLKIKETDKISWHYKED